MAAAAVGDTIEDVNQDSTSNTGPIMIDHITKYAIESILRLIQ